MKIGHIQYPFNGVKMIYNNDEKAIDFLLDMNMKGMGDLLRTIEGKDDNFTTTCLHSSTLDIYVMLIYKPISYWNRLNQGKYIVFASPSHERFIVYMNRFRCYSIDPVDQNAICRLISDTLAHSNYLRTKDSSIYETTIGGFFKRKQ